jgi:glycosyltransferase involved in cell wall biosynthesis
VIPNAIKVDRFDTPDPVMRCELERMFERPVRRIIGAVGRLSPEKGFSVLVDAAAIVTRAQRGVGFVLFGDGVLQPALEAQVAAKGLCERFVLAGFRPDLDRLLPNLDLLVQSSYTEGMPNVVLEASAAGVSVVATAVGGTPEILEDGKSGWLVPAGDSHTLAARMLEVLSDEERRRTMGLRGKQKVQREFSFEFQAVAYARLFDVLLAKTDADQANRVRADCPKRASQSVSCSSEQAGWDIRRGT